MASPNSLVLTACSYIQVDLGHLGGSLFPHVLAASCWYPDVVCQLKAVYEAISCFFHCHCFLVFLKYDKC